MSVSHCRATVLALALSALAWACLSILSRGVNPALRMPLRPTDAARAATPPAAMGVQKRIRRLRDVRGMLDSRRRAPAAQIAADTIPVGAWDDVDVYAPNVSDRRTLLALAQMTMLAYYPERPETIPDAQGWFWGNATIVIALKGTSAALLPGGGDTAQRDKENDNLLFSCCCARVNRNWTPVCDCYAENHSCDNSCVGRALIEQSLYYPAATDMYNNISYLYPNSTMWIVGHSLGGVLASLLGATFGVPAISYEAPGDRLAATRLHLPLPPPDVPRDDAFALAPVTHVYHTADPLATGQCQGLGSLCSATGYALETKCHMGLSVVYDTEKYLGWQPSVLSHRITYVIEELLTEDWDKRVCDRAVAPAAGAALGAVPAASPESQCEECIEWTFT
ncbi:triacylglycerol lipase [Malassezia sp. CBS 17886]|nr:triacylglycerol lipase [Malassezia sp. CBS 17886]